MRKLLGRFDAASSPARTRLGDVTGQSSIAYGKLQTVATNEPHGVIRPSVSVSAQTIDWHDAGVLQTTGNFRFDEIAQFVVVCILLL